MTREEDERMLDMHVAYDIVSAGNGDMEIDARLTALESLRERPAADAYLEIALLALARVIVQLAALTEPGR